MNVNVERDKKASQLTDLLLSRDDFQDDVKRMRKAWFIPEGGLKTPEEYIEWQDNYMVLEEVDTSFKKSISTVFIKPGRYGLNAPAWKPLLHYILKGEVPHNINGSAPVIVQVPGRYSGKAEYSMKIYEHTTEAEVRKAFGEFKASHFKDRRQQLIPAVKLEKMKRAQELKNNGLSWKQVAETVNAELGGTLT